MAPKVKFLTDRVDVSMVESILGQFDFTGVCADIVFDAVSGCESPACFKPSDLEFSASAPLELRGPGLPPLVYYPVHVWDGPTAEQALIVAHEMQHLVQLILWPESCAKCFALQWSRLGYDNAPNEIDADSVSLRVAVHVLGEDMVMSHVRKMAESAPLNDRWRYRNFLSGTIPADYDFPAETDRLFEQYMDEMLESYRSSPIPRSLREAAHLLRL